MLNVFHHSASLRLGCALGLAWPVAMYAIFLAIAWFPTDPYSAAGDLSWVDPTIVTLVATVATTHMLLIAAPQFGRLRRGYRMAIMVPVILVLASAAITFARA